MKNQSHVFLYELQDNYGLFLGTELVCISCNREKMEKAAQDMNKKYNATVCYVRMVEND